MEVFKKYSVGNYKDFMKLPCGFYDTVDIIMTDGIKKNRVRAGDVFLQSNEIEQWRLSEIQGLSKSEMSGGGYYHDSTAPSSAQEYGLEDRDFEFF